jgi:soluble lytic murein transglycosylase-like protein
MLRRFVRVLLPALAGAAIFAAPAAANVLEIGDDGEVRTRTDTPAAGWETAAEKAAAAERRALMIEAATSAPTIGTSAPALVVGQAAAVPAAAVTPIEITAAHLRHVPAPLVGSILAAARKYELSPLLIDAVARQESGYRVNAVSRVGAIGVMQLMPGTARMLGVRNPRDPHANIDGGARYLRRLLDRFGGDVSLALAAYNAGPGRVERARGIPRIAETQKYVTKILARLASGAAAASAAAQAVVQVAKVSGELE